MTADREALRRESIRQMIATKDEYGFMVAMEVLDHCKAERDQLKAENGRLRGRAQELVEQSNELYAEVERLRGALEAVAVSKFATEPHRIARDALESISPGKP